MCATFSLFSEPQAPPEILSVFDIRQTSLNVSWSLIGPRPGRVTYTVHLNADKGATSKTYTVEGVKIVLSYTCNCKSLMCEIAFVHASSNAQKYTIHCMLRLIVSRICEHTVLC